MMITKSLQISRAAAVMDTIEMPWREGVILYSVQGLADVQ